MNIYRTTNITNRRCRIFATGTPPRLKPIVLITTTKKGRVHSLGSTVKIPQNPITDYATSPLA
jgi:hypothetical protein